MNYSDRHSSQENFLFYLRGNKAVVIAKLCPEARFPSSFRPWRGSKNCKLLHSPAPIPASDKITAFTWALALLNDNHCPMTDSRLQWQSTTLWNKASSWGAEGRNDWTLVTTEIKSQAASRLKDAVMLTCNPRCGNVHVSRDLKGQFILKQMFSKPL